MELARIDFARTPRHGRRDRKGRSIPELETALAETPDDGAHTVIVIDTDPLITTEGRRATGGRRGTGGWTETR